MFELLGEKRELQDRSCDEVREHGNEAGEIDEVRHRLRLAAVDIDRVTERLESIEADPEWQDDAKECVPMGVRETERVDQPVVALNAEVEVFEETEDGQVRN